MFGDVCFLDFFGGMAFSSQGFWGGFPPLLSTFVSQFLFFLFAVQIAAASEKVLSLPSEVLWGKWLSP